MSMPKEVEIGKKRQNNPVVGKRGQCRFVQKAQKPDYGEICHDKRNQKTDDNHLEIRGRQARPAFSQVINTGHGHERQGNDERKVRRRFAIQTKKQAAGNRGPGS